MNRRSFLGLTAAAMGTAAWPGFLRRAFADTSVDGLAGKDGPIDLGDGARTAKRSGKPLLIFIIPEKDEEKWERGRSFGELINHGTPPQIAPLGLCEVVCAKVSDVHKIAPAIAGEPLMVLVETDGSARPIDGKLPSYEHVGRGGGEDWTKMVKREDAIADRRIAALSALIAGAVTPDRETLDRRLAALKIPSLPPGASMGAVNALLSQSVAARLKDRRVPGSYWANASGCGTSVEGDEESLGVACGMGHVPAKSSRFLYMFAQTPSQRHRDWQKQQKDGK